MDDFQEVLAHGSCAVETVPWFHGHVVADLVDLARHIDDGPGTEQLHSLLQPGQAASSRFQGAC